MSGKIILFEDDAALTLEPLTLTRPVWDLLCGLMTLREKIESFFPGVDLACYLREYLRPLASRAVTSLSALSGDELWINGALIPEFSFTKLLELKTGVAAVQGGRALGFRGNPPSGWQAGTRLPLEGFQIVEADNIGCFVIHPWELVHRMNAEVNAEAQKYRSLGVISGKVHPTAVLLEKGQIFIGVDAVIDPLVVLDARSGPIVIDEQAHIGAHAIIEGPTFIGPKTQVKPLTSIRGSSFGEDCRLGGEISVSIMQAYSNKQHGGFLGHSYLGSWCNLGSGTETSNLKNNYTSILVQQGKKSVDTGELFVGLMMGDHSKSAIGTVFNTGTLVGIACNVFGSGFPPKFIPSFHWGGADKLTPYHLKGTLNVARAVMQRRGKELREEDANILRWIHDNRTTT